MSVSQVPDDVVDGLEERVAPDCGDCDTPMKFRAIQGGDGLRVGLQFICPTCTPDRVKVIEPPEWLEIEVPSCKREHGQAGLGEWSG